MRTYTLGDGPPEVAVVGAIHGDEPCGETAVERLVADDPPVDRPVKLVVANEEALARGVRYVDTDLNRAFDDGATGHEARLARELAAEIRGLRTLSLHSTRSYGEPIGIVNGTTGSAREIVVRLPVATVVDVADRPEGRPFAIEATPLVEAECGFQGSDEAADNAERLSRAFLAATGALSPAPEPRPLPVYRLGDPVSKPPARRYEVFVENFQRVPAGDAYARADDRALVAETAFYPVLFSADGYENIFGYAADATGELTLPDAAGNDD